MGSWLFPGYGHLSLGRLFLNSRRQLSSDNHGGMGLPVQIIVCLILSFYGQVASFSEVHGMFINHFSTWGKCI